MLTMFIFTVSDFISGGELLELLRRYCILPVVLVQIYIAQLALTLGKNFFYYIMKTFCILSFFFKFLSKLFVEKLRT